MIELDTTHAPLIVVRVSGYLQSDDLRRSIRAYEGVLDAEIEHQTLLMVRESSPRRRALDFVDTVAKSLGARATAWRRCCAACALVIEQSALRRELAETSLLSSSDETTRTFGELGPALGWLDERAGSVDASIASPQTLLRTIAEGTDPSPADTTEGVDEVRTEVSHEL